MTVVQLSTSITPLKQIMGYPTFESAFLTSPIPEVLGLTFFTLTSWFFIIRKLRLLATEKQLAWLISLTYASGLALGGLPFLYRMLQIPFSQEPNPLAWADEESTLSRGLSAFFFMGLSLDMLIGALYYREHMDLLTTWIHHPIYMGLLVYGIRYGYTSYFAMMCPLELPTVILSLGVVNPKLRNEPLFGIAFFLTRILYHGYCVVLSSMFSPSKDIPFILACILPVHIFWFRGFIYQQLRRRAHIINTFPILGQSPVLSAKSISNRNSHAGSDSGSNYNTFKSTLTTMGN